MDHESCAKSSKTLHNKAAATHLNYGIFLFNCFKVDVLQQFFFAPIQLHLKINFLKAHEIFVVCIICNFFKNDGSLYLFLRLQLESFVRTFVGLLLYALSLNSFVLYDKMGGGKGFTIEEMCSLVS